MCMTREFNLKNLSINLSRCDNFLDQNNSIEEKTSYVDGLVTKFPNQEYFLNTLLPDNFAGSIDDNDIHTNTDQIGYYQVLQPVIASDLDSEGIIFNELSTDNEGCSSIVISLQDAPDSQLYYLPVSFVDDVDGMECPDGCELSQSQSGRLQTVLTGSKTDKNVGENSSKICVKTNTLVKGLSSTSDISSQSEINLQNDVMLGSKLIVSDDDNYVEELMNFLPVKSDGLNEVATDLSHTELGFEWHGDMKRDRGRQRITFVKFLCHLLNITTFQLLQSVKDRVLWRPIVANVLKVTRSRRSCHNINHRNVMTNLRKSGLQPEMN
ncbi:hypothetical protein HELRODRAFT_173817 [Helobdella robusta]|uniref:Uncharacterized protein n=1 Tax=Helobdella robusta TaxID=6412 RepID=T1F797_HELRO|nr:hypothetical protein HELRODRAFT_173817 [Helobdella robusta]ESO02982.1 hypothetical protein HELRODRAFT_173817 [Helobdella robusta]